MSEVSAVRDRKFTALDAAASPFNVDYPNLVETGDVLELLVCGNSSSMTFTATGWTSLAYVGGTGRAAEKFWRTATGGEAGSTFALSGSATTDFVCIVRAIRGDLNPGTPETAGDFGGSPLDPPSLTPSGGDRLYLWTVDGAIRFGNNLITEWDANPDLDQRIQKFVTDIAINGFGSERLFEAATYDPAAMPVTTSNTIAFTTAIPVDAPAASGSFPVVESTSQDSWDTASTEQTLTLPAGVSEGDLLVATIAGDNDPTVTIDGWDVVATDANPAGSVGGTVLQKEADGTEGATVTVDFSPSDTGSYICRRISGADGTKTDAATNSSDNAQSVVWPDLTPADGADDILWLTDEVTDSDRSLVGWPVNFGAVPLLEQDGSIGTDSAASGVLIRNIASVSPGTGLVGPTQEDWVTFTVAIYPSGSGPTPPPSGGGNRMGDGRAIRKPPRTPR